jgi:hypothetical protein
LPLLLLGMVKTCFTRATDIALQSMTWWTGLDDKLELFTKKSMSVCVQIRDQVCCQRVGIGGCCGVPESCDLQALGDTSLNTRALIASQT